MFAATSNRNNALQLYSIVIASTCLSFLPLGAADTPKYNLIHCQSDLWCFEDSIDFQGSLRKVCEGIDPIMPNYKERGLLQTNNYARLFPDEWQEEYGRSFQDGCVVTPTHPLWESRGATEEAHFLSVSTRDCSVGVSSHNTCKDFCYEDAAEKDQSDVYKPIVGCAPKFRKEEFQWNALKKGSYEDKTNTRYIQFNAEARCGANWPCTDKGHCGCVFNPARFLTGIGRALGESGVSSYFKGTRTYKFKNDGGSGTIENQMKFWEYYGDGSVLHRIPSGAHYDKCVLMNDCNTRGTFEHIYFQFTYSHYDTLWQDGTAKVYIDNTPYTMAKKEETREAAQGQNWAIFETDFNIIYPTTCQSYYFEIEDVNGVTVRLPEDDAYKFATTGNGCDLNHFFTDEDGTWDNCKGEHSGPALVSDAVPATSPPITAVPATSPPTAASLTGAVPATGNLCENVVEHTPEFTTYDQTWSHFKMMQLGDHFILGEYGKNNQGMEDLPSKEFDVSTEAEEVEISFDFYEIDEWESYDTAAVVINNDQTIPLGQFSGYGSDATNDNQIYTFDGDEHTDIFLTRQRKGEPEHLGKHAKKKDQIHSVVITIPQHHYSRSGSVKFMLSLNFDQSKERKRWIK